MFESMRQATLESFKRIPAPPLELELVSVCITTTIHYPEPIRVGSYDIPGRRVDYGRELIPLEDIERDGRGRRMYGIGNGTITIEWMGPRPDFLKLLAAIGIAP